MIRFFNKKSWNRKRCKLYKTIKSLDLKYTVTELWEIYIVYYFTTMELGQFCKALINKNIKL